jgi:XTP/dITP diphosphohydrolase
VKLLVATRSAHKMTEIRRILGHLPSIEVLSLDDAGVPHDPEAEAGLEPYDTFEENAASKARHFRALSGLPTVADDSGLEVDALDGAPGVRSKRFAPVPPGTEGEARDQANNAWLLERLGDLEPRLRTARYVCVAVLDEGQGRTASFRGEAEGLIAENPRGAGGFGYDPLFYDPELDRTFAEIPREEKNARSHRGAAFRALADHLAGRASESP